MPTSKDIAQLSRTQLFIVFSFGFFRRILLAVAYVALLGSSAMLLLANTNNASSPSLHY